jgi:hypothetical protein
MTPECGGSSGREKRRSPRLATELKVRFWSAMLDFEGKGEILEADISDVSGGGVFVRSDFLEVPGTAVCLLVILPEHGLIPLRGHVAWVAEEPPKGPGMGIRLAAPINSLVWQAASRQVH